ncbi:hypothetical protein AN958_10354, partial [Leucoagaricus sp. SymC.cos]
FRCLFTGATSAVMGRRDCAKSSKSEIHELKEVTDRTIAYVCVLARQTLSSSQKYSTIDGTFDYAYFYKFILELLWNKNEPWVQDTLEYWNMYTFSISCQYFCAVYL